ncbi:MAG TPA: type II secretion system F family protein [Clostridiales bacterium]|nr:type II secretion system F family protein [Clostridiales bacterium]
MPDYNVYIMGMKQKICYTLSAAAVIFAAGFLFYRSVFISVLLTPLALLYPRIKTKDIIRRRKKELNIQFKDLLYSLASSVSAGKSIESAFRAAIDDLSVLYPDPSAYILVEIRNIVSRLDTNETLESALSEFAGRAGLEDIDNFVNVLNISRRAGGNIAQIIRNTSSIISDRIEVGQEIDMLLAERRFEQKVLNAVPVFMTVLLSVSAPDYMYPVFNTAAGRLTMTISLAIMAAAWLISSKLNDIKV